MRNPLQGNQALARWNSSAFTRVVSERGRDELCSSRALTVKNGAVRWGVMAGVPAEPVPRATGSGGCLPRPGGEADRWARLSLSVPCTHFVVLFLALCLWAVMGPSNTCSLASLLPLCLSLSLSTFLFPSLSDLFIYFFNFIIITPRPY